MSKSQGSEDTKVAVRSNDFRYIPADYINLALSEDGIKLILGVEEAGRPATELVGIHMSLGTANGLSALLRDAIEHAKEEFGANFDEPKVGSKSY